MTIVVVSVGETEVAERVRSEAKALRGIVRVQSGLMGALVSALRNGWR